MGDSVIHREVVGPTDVRSESPMLSNPRDCVFRKALRAFLIDYPNINRLAFPSGHLEQHARHRVSLPDVTIQLQRVRVWEGRRRGFQEDRLFGWSAPSARPLLCWCGCRLRPDHPERNRLQDGATEFANNFPAPADPGLGLRGRDRPLVGFPDSHSRNETFGSSNLRVERNSGWHRALAFQFLPSRL